jgi:hypothetical protein
MRDDARMMRDRSEPGPRLIDCGPAAERATAMLGIMKILHSETLPGARPAATPC